MKYPEEWKDLPKKERKKNIKELQTQTLEKNEFTKRIRIGIVILAFVLLGVAGYRYTALRSAKSSVFEQKVKEVSLEGKVQEYPEEGREHVPAGTDVNHSTNPPTSGGHYDDAADWGVYHEEIPDEAAVHALEHGGIWITYNEIDESTKNTLEDIAKENPASVLISPRAANDTKIAIVSWQHMMKLETVDKAFIQKYINTYINKSPEKLAR